MCQSLPSRIPLLKLKMTTKTPDETTSLLRKQDRENNPPPYDGEDEPNIPATSCCRKVSQFLSNITVEPILFIHSLAISVDGIFYTNMLIDKTCKIQLNYSNEICDNLDSGNYETQQDEVQRITNKYQLYGSWIEYAPSIFMILILGTWSDVRDRKLPLAFPMIGSTLKALGLLINAYIWSLQPYFAILSYIPYGLVGGAMSIYLAAYAFVGDNSGVRSRTIRISFTGMMMYVASPFGHGIGTLLYTYGGYKFVFGTEFILSFISVIYVLVRFKDQPHYQKRDDMARTTNDKRVTLAALKASVKVVTKKRSGYQRAHLIAHICCIWIFITSFEAGSYTYLYARKKFSWDYYTYTLWSIVNTPVSLLSTCFLLPLLSYYYQLEDSLLGFIGSSSHIFYGIIIGTAPVSWAMYIALVISSLSGMVFSSSRGAISKLVKSDELGAVFSIIAMGETIFPLINKPIFTFIYNSTLETYPGTIFLIEAGIGVLACCLYTWILTSGNNKKIKNIPNP